MYNIVSVSYSTWYLDPKVILKWGNPKPCLIGESSVYWCQIIFKNCYLFSFCSPLSWHQITIVPFLATGIFVIFQGKPYHCLYIACNLSDLQNPKNSGYKYYLTNPCTVFLHLSTMPPPHATDNHSTYNLQARLVTFWWAFPKSLSPPCPDSIPYLHISFEPWVPRFQCKQPLISFFGHNFSHVNTRGSIDTLDASKTEMTVFTYFVIFPQGLRNEL